MLWSSTLCEGIPDSVVNKKTESFDGWTRAYSNYPEFNINSQVGGLQFIGDFTKFKKFDIIHMVLVSISDIGNYYWNQIPTLIRETCGNKPKIVMQIDNEMACVPPDDNVKKSMDSSDMVIAVTKMCLDEWQKYTSTPIRYVANPRYNPNLTPVSPENRTKTIAIMNHTWIPKDNKMLDTQLDVVAKLGWGCKIFTAKGNDDGIESYNLARSKGIRNVESFKRLSGEDYFRELSTCFVGIEDGYVGANRFATECSYLQVPILGTVNATACTVVCPELITNVGDVDSKVELINKLCGNSDYYVELCKHSYTRTIQHYSENVCVERMIEAWSECGLLE